VLIYLSTVEKKVAFEILGHLFKQKTCFKGGNDDDYEQNLCSHCELGYFVAFELRWDTT
jgi:hypothetical protein